MGTVRLTAAEGKKNGQKNADDNITCQQEVKSEIFPLNTDISGKFAQPRDFGPEEENQARKGQN